MPRCKHRCDELLCPPKRYVELLASKEWCYCILDEGHLLKNPKKGEFCEVLFVLYFTRHKLTLYFDDAALPDASRRVSSAP
jgi:hypothetical protein